MKRFFLFILLLSFLIPTGCGYHVVGWEADRHGGGRSVHIPIFANKTFKPNLENVLANALTDEFVKRRGLAVADSAGAEMTLSGEVLSYGLKAVSYSAADTEKEYAATMRVAATLRRGGNRQVIWKGEFSWDQAFPANANIALQQNAEDAAIQEICRRLAQRIYLKIVEDF